MNIGEQRKIIIIEPLEEPKWIEEPAPAVQPAEPRKEPVPA